ncbi:hypothetical protein Bbelb_123990 [Branchiostoma belcheri]|nr:hypothetical protein Bbelb_123990 [Branchiostoma belcheri]
MEVRDASLSPENQCDEDVNDTSAPPPLPPKCPPPLPPRTHRSHMGDGVAAEAERRNEPVSIYEDTDPHGESIFEEPSQEDGTYEDVDKENGGGDVKLRAGLRRAVPDAPPSRNSNVEDRASVREEQKPCEESSPSPCYKREDTAGDNTGVPETEVEDHTYEHVDGEDSDRDEKQEEGGRK